MTLCYDRFGSRELVGGVAVQLEHADLFGLTVHSRIEPQSSGQEVRSDNVVVHDLRSMGVHLVEFDLCGVYTLLMLNMIGSAYTFISFQFQTYGDILFSLTYKPDMHKINGIILKATGLQKQDITGAAGVLERF